MIDAQVEQLLRQAVDTPTKLHVLLIFHEHSGLEETAYEVAERTCRDIWSIRQALFELAEDGILQISQTVGDPTYSYRPCREYVEPIRDLMKGYNDPLQRNKLHRSIRELASFAAFRRSAASGSA